MILPLSLASFITGVVQALARAWGLVRHYWVIAKLLLTVFATGLLLLKLSPISDLAEAAAQATFSSTSLPDLKLSLLVHSVGGLVSLLGISILALYKPAGLTRLAVRREAGSNRVVANFRPLPRWVRVSVILAGSLALALALLVLHCGHGPAMHSAHGV